MNELQRTSARVGLRHTSTFSGHSERDRLNQDEYFCIFYIHNHEGPIPVLRV